MNPSGHTDERRARLDALRRSAQRRVAGLADGLDAIVDAATDVATDDEHDPEGHTIAWERQQVAALLADAEATIAQIDAAFTRLADDRYGICVGCDRPISAARLEALPAALTCVACAPGSGAGR